MNLKIPFILIFLTGLAMFIYSRQLPYYMDQAAFEKLRDDSMEKIDQPKFKATYYATEAALRTSKVYLMDLGAGLTIAAGVVLAFMLVKKINRISDLKSLQTFKLLTIYLSANLMWFLMIPGSYWYYGFRAERGDYPWFADSIGIPLMGSTMFFLMCFIPLNVFILITTIRHQLPSRVFIAPDTYSRNEVLKEIFWGFWLLLNFAILVSFITDGDHVSIVINLFFTYILLNLRAGQIDHHKPLFTLNSEPDNDMV